MAIQVAYSLTDAQLAQLRALYDGEWWSRDRSEADVRTMLEHCSIAALVDGDALLAFARAVSDRVFKALVLDVIVRDDQRGNHLGQRVMEALHAHPELQQVRHFELYCLPALDPFYTRFGYTSALGDLQLMRNSRSR